MNMQRIRQQAFVVLALGVLVLPPAAFAEPPADKGKPEAAQGQDRDKGVDKSAPGHEARPQDGNRGAVVSDCNHRANTRKLQGAERQDYVEWCTERGARHQYDQRRFDQDRACYRRAADKGLAGDARRSFIEKCLHERDRNR